MKPSVIVWDLETVPDIAGFAAANDLVGKSDVEVREAIGDKFPKHIYHSIVCIGALIAHREPESLGGGRHRRPSRRRENREAADHILLRQGRGAEPAARHRPDGLRARPASVACCGRAQRSA
jgi:hypothetical protein